MEFARRRSTVHGHPLCLSERLPWSTQCGREFFHVRHGHIRGCPVWPKARCRRALPKLDSWPVKPGAHAHGVVAAGKAACDALNPFQAPSNQRWHMSPSVGVRAHGSDRSPQQPCEQGVTQIASQCHEHVLVHGAILRRSQLVVVGDGGGTRVVTATCAGPLLGWCDRVPTSSAMEPLCGRAPR
jgi:hypothetical protein